jgi:hypothetical protein
MGGRLTRDERAIANVTDTLKGGNYELEQAFGVGQGLA